MSEISSYLIDYELSKFGTRFSSAVLNMLHSSTLKNEVRKIAQTLATDYYSELEEIDSTEPAAFQKPFFGAPKARANIFNI